MISHNMIVNINNFISRQVAKNAYSSPGRSGTLNGIRWLWLQQLHIVGNRGLRHVEILQGPQYKFLTRLTLH